MMNSKLWNYSLMFLAVGFFAYAGFRLIKPRALGGESSGLIADYSMPRPEGYSADFSIKDREVNRRYLKQASKVIPGAPADVTAVKPLSEEEKKAEAIKAAKAKEEKRKQAEKEKQKNRFAVEKMNSVDTFGKLAARASDSENEFKASGTNSFVEQQAVNDRTPTSPIEEVKPPEENALSAQDWLLEIRRNPTPQTAQSLVEALRQSRVSSAEYSSISRELLRDQDPRLQEIGLLLADFNPGIESFKILVESESLLSGELLAKQQQMVAKYGNISRSAALAQTLNDPELTEKSLSLVELALKNEQTKRNSSDPREIRGQGRTPAQSTHLVTLSMGLTSLASAGNSYAAKAQELIRVISELQSL